MFVSAERVGTNIIFRRLGVFISMSGDSISAAPAKSNIKGVDDAGNTGLFGDLVLDDNDIPHISYFIATGDYGDLAPEVKADPKVAMTSGNEGLDAIKSIISKAPDHLAPGGRLIFEIGYQQGEKVAALTANDDRYKSISILKDLNDIDRVIMLACGD